MPMGTSSQKVFLISCMYFSADGSCPILGEEEKRLLPTIVLGVLLSTAIPLKFSRWALHVGPVPLLSVRDHYKQVQVNRLCWRLPRKHPQGCSGPPEGQIAGRGESYHLAGSKGAWYLAKRPPEPDSGAGQASRLRLVEAWSAAPPEPTWLAPEGLVSPMLAWILLLSGACGVTCGIPFGRIASSTGGPPGLSVVGGGERSRRKQANDDAIHSVSRRPQPEPKWHSPLLRKRIADI